MLRGFQRRYLRKLAHGRKALVQVGDAGISQTVFEAIDSALLDHELVKVRLRQPDDKKAEARSLSQRCGAELCGVVGHTVILYRPHPEKPAISLPESDE